MNRRILFLPRRSTCLLIVLLITSGCLLPDEPEVETPSDDITVITSPTDTSHTSDSTVTTGGDTAVVHTDDSTQIQPQDSVTYPPVDSTQIIDPITPHPTATAAVVWEKGFGSNNLLAYAMRRTRTGDLFAAGWASGGGHPEGSAAVMTIDTAGNLLTSRSYVPLRGGSGASIGTLRETSDGGYIMCGTTSSAPAAPTGFYLLRTDAYGARLWDNVYAANEYRVARDVIQTADGGYLICGSVSGLDVYSNTILLIKTDAYGSPEWERRIDLGYSAYASAIVPSPLFGYILAVSATDGPFSVISIDDTAGVMWHVVTGLSGWVETTAIEEAPDGTIVIGGWVREHGSSHSRMFLSKMSTTGSIVWIRRLGESNSMLNDLRVTTDGGIIVCGSTNDRVSVLKTGQDGSEAWRWTRERPDYGYATSIEQVSDDEFIVCGYAADFQAASMPAYIAKIRNH